MGHQELLFGKSRPAEVQWSTKIKRMKHSDGRIGERARHVVMEPAILPDCRRRRSHERSALWVRRSFFRRGGDEQTKATVTAKSGPLATTLVTIFGRPVGVIGRLLGPPKAESVRRASRTRKRKGPWRPSRQNWRSKVPGPFSVAERWRGIPRSTIAPQYTR